MNRDHIDHNHKAKINRRIFSVIVSPPNAHIGEPLEQPAESTRSSEQEAVVVEQPEVRPVGERQDVDERAQEAEVQIVQNEGFCEIPQIEVVLVLVVLEDCLAARFDVSVGAVVAEEN
jgi:hypothetical protein